MIDVGRYPASQTVVGRVLRAPLRLIPKDLVMPILQGPLRGKRWITGSSIHRVWLGSYEVSKMAIAWDSVKPGDTVFDVGANVGIYTLLFSERVGANGRVVAFEPSPRNVSYLRRHLALNGIANVQVIEAAVSAQNGSAQFNAGSDAATGRLDSNGAIGVNTVAIDPFVECGGYAPSLIKVDVEGGEADVLWGALTTLGRARPTVLLATHSDALKRTCTTMLRQCRYEVRELEDDRGTPIPDELICRPLRGVAD